LNDFTYEFLPWRGITSETFRYFDVKTKCDGSGNPVSIGFKYPSGGYKVRSLAEKEFYTTGEVVGLFGRDKFAAGSSRAVTITEGELDAVSLYQVLKTPVVSVRSSATARIDASRDRSWLNAFDRVYLCFDEDAPGRDAAAEVAKLFDPNKVYRVRLTKRKDPNEYVRHGEADELKTIWYNSRQYLPDNIVSSLEDFKKILTEAPKQGIPYPFPTLTEMTYGIRPSESVLFTAMEGVGKTELMHAIEYKLLRETDANVAAIYLEEPKGRHLQALAGLTLGRPVHLPDSGCTDVETYTALQSCLQKDDRLYLYSHFGSDRPEVLLDTIRFLVSVRMCRYVILDHISMVVSGLSGEDERKALDYFATQLEMMVKELDFSLLMVSHVNDNNQTRGSRLIKKVADISVNIMRDLLHPDPVVRNTSTLIIDKNRFCGKTGFAGSIYFDPVTYSYSEVAANANENRPFVRPELCAA
jgi:twinkle protein